MKKLTLLFIAAFSIIQILAQAQQSGNYNTTTEMHALPADDNKSPEMFFENQSKYDFGETVEKLKVAVEAKTWKLTAIHDLQQTMKTYGKDVLPVKVFAVCHPKHSSQILEQDDARIVSCMMPCRISIYQKSDGKTYISRMNPAPMAMTFGGTVEKVMTDSASEIEEIISDIILGK